MRLLRPPGSREPVSKSLLSRNFQEHLDRWVRTPSCSISLLREVQQRAGDLLFLAFLTADVLNLAHGYVAGTERIA